MQWKPPGDPRHQASISARQPVSYCNFPYLIHLGCILKPVLPFYRRFLWDSFRQ